MFDRPLAATSATADNYADGDSLPNTDTEIFQFGAQCFSRALGGVLYRLTDTSAYPGTVTPGAGRGEWVPEPHPDVKGHIVDDGTILNNQPLPIVGNLGISSVVRIDLGVYAITLFDSTINTLTSIMHATFKTNTAPSAGICFGGRFTPPDGTVQIGRFNIALGFENGDFDFFLYANFV